MFVSQSELQFSINTTTPPSTPSTLKNSSTYFHNFKTFGATILYHSWPIQLCETFKIQATLPLASDLIILGRSY